MEKPIDFWLRKGKAVGETKPTERGDRTFWDTFCKKNARALLALVFTQIRKYRQWCEDNFSTLDNIDVQWIIRYCIMLVLIGLNYVNICVAHGHTRGFTQQWIEREKPYLNPDFQLTDLRLVLPMNRTYLSQFINNAYGSPPKVNNSKKCSSWALFTFFSCIYQNILLPLQRICVQCKKHEQLICVRCRKHKT